MVDLLFCIWNLLKVGLCLRYKGEKVTFLNSHLIQNADNVIFEMWNQEQKRNATPPKKKNQKQKHVYLLQIILIIPLL